MKTAPNSPKGSVLLIGAGRMGGALLKGWVQSGAFAAIHAIEPTPSPAVKALARDKTITLHLALERGLPNVSAVVLALKPQVMKGEHDLLAALGRTGALVLSIAAGVTTGFLSAALGPGVRIVRAMPNTPGAIGKGITVLFTPAKLTAADRILAESLMSSLG